MSSVSTGPVIRLDNFRTFPPFRPLGDMGADASHERPAVPNQRNLSVLLRHCSANGIRGIELAQQHVAFAMAADICPIPRTMSVVSAPLKSTESLTPPLPTLSTTSTLSGRYSATKDER